MFKKLIRYIKDPYYALGYDLIKNHSQLMSDKFYIKTLWKMCMGYELNLKHPVTFNEKLQWLKLHDHNPIYPLLVDKVRVKDWVAEKIGAEHVIPTLAIYKSVDEIDLDKLPNQFVLKCNHDSGSVIICKEKKEFDLVAAKQKLNKALHHNFYWDAREWAYKKVKPLIFAEQYMEDTRTGELQDYKFFSFDGVPYVHSLEEMRNDLVTYKFLCFDGEPKIMYMTVKNEDIWENYYDMDFKQLPIGHGRRISDEPIAKPICFEEMKRIAATLSQDMPHVRIDLYQVAGQVYFSEYTFYDWAGLTPFDDKKWDLQLGDYIHLPK